jgi:hypothetical protein
MLLIADRYWPPMMRPFLFCCGDVTSAERAGTNGIGLRAKQAITDDMDLRLGHWFGGSAEFWLNLQGAYELRVAAKAAGRSIAKLPTRHAA